MPCPSLVQFKAPCSRPSPAPAHKAFWEGANARTEQTCAMLGHQQQCQSSSQACGDPHALLLTQLTADRHTPTWHAVAEPLQSWACLGQACREPHLWLLTKLMVGTRTPSSACWGPITVKSPGCCRRKPTSCSCSGCSIACSENKVQIRAQWAQAGQERCMTSQAGRERCMTCLACAACTAMQVPHTGHVSAQCCHRTSRTAARQQFLQHGCVSGSALQWGHFYPKLGRHCCQAMLQTDQLSALPPLCCSSSAPSKPGATMQPPLYRP